MNAQDRINNAHVAWMEDAEGSARQDDDFTAGFVAGVEAAIKALRLPGEVRWAQAHDSAASRGWNDHLLVVSERLEALKP